jgi:hypothetical protein
MGRSGTEVLHDPVGSTVFVLIPDHGTDPGDLQGRLRVDLRSATGVNHPDRRILSGKIPDQLPRLSVSLIRHRTRIDHDDIGIRVTDSRTPTVLQQTRLDLLTI